MCRERRGYGEALMYSLAVAAELAKNVARQDEG